MHYVQFNQIVRDAEIANVISSVVREHRLTEGEMEKALLELRAFLAPQTLPGLALAPNPVFRGSMPNMR